MPIGQASSDRTRIRPHLPAPMKSMLCIACQVCMMWARLRARAVLAARLRAGDAHAAQPGLHLARGQHAVAVRVQRIVGAPQARLARVHKARKAPKAAHASGVRPEASTLDCIKLYAMPPVHASMQPWRYFLCFRPCNKQYPAQPMACAYAHVASAFSTYQGVTGQRMRLGQAAGEWTMRGLANWCGTHPMCSALASASPAPCSLPLPSPRSSALRNAGT